MAALVGRFDSFFAAIALLSMLAGCSSSQPELYEVRGVVTFQDQPLPLGLVTFVSDSYRPTSALIDANGRFVLEAVPGEQKVEVIANKYLTDDKSKPSTNIDVGETQPLIPAKYNRYQTSGIVVKVEAKSVNEINIHLK